MKIAFLIMAHTDPDQLHRLLHALDDPRFDLFVRKVTTEVSGKLLDALDENRKEV